MRWNVLEPAFPFLSCNISGTERLQTWTHFRVAIVHGIAKSDTTEWLSLSFTESSSHEMHEFPQTGRTFFTQVPSSALNWQYCLLSFKLFRSYCPQKKAPGGREYVWPLTFHLILTVPLGRVCLVQGPASTSGLQEKSPDWIQKTWLYALSHCSKALSSHL